MRRVLRRILPLFALDGDWRRRHITVTEACGTVLTLMVLSKYFPEGEIMIESDASASLATTRATADAPDLIYLRRRARRQRRRFEPPRGAPG